MIELTRAQEARVEELSFIHWSVQVFPPETEGGDITIYGLKRAKASYHLPPSHALRTAAIIVIGSDGTIKESR